jgi:hypothetical protein
MHTIATAHPKSIAQIVNVPIGIGACKKHLIIEATRKIDALVEEGAHRFGITSVHSGINDHYTY